MEKFSVADLLIERLNDKHYLNNFQSYEKELVEFLKEDALENQKNKISVTYLWFLKGSGQLLGYITVLNDRINLESELKEGFRNKGINYHSLPALKVGRLCVDDRFIRRGLGTMMIDFSISIAHSIFEDYSGCRFIVLDAKRTIVNDPIHFYKKQGFETLKERKKGTTPMYLDLLNNVKFST